MASEYYKWKFRDVKHREEREYTDKEKRQNWWYYNKWLVIGGIIGAFVLVDLFRTVTGMKTVRPDVRIAFVTESRLSEEDIDALENSLAKYAQDYNNDKKTLVEVRQFLMPGNPTAEEVMYAQYASEVTLISDMDQCDSFLFIMKDPDSFQKAFEVFAYPDGTLSSASTKGSECAFAIKDLKAFQTLEIDSSLKEFMNGYYIARRGFWTERTCENYEGCIEFFTAITRQKGN